MRSLCRWAVFLIILAGVAGCGGQKGAKLQKSVIPADKTLFDTGNNFNDKAQYTQARLAFQTLIRTYPDSELQADAYFAMGTSYVKEGGTENYLLAEDQFRNFIIFFPTNPRAPEAAMQVIALLMRNMHEPDRDQRDTELAADAIQKFMIQYPNNDYVPALKQFLDEVHEVLATRDLWVGDYYAKINDPLGALSRYKELTEKYPHFSKKDEAYFKIAEVMQKLKNPDEATKYLDLIAVGFPFSKYYDQAKTQLQAMGKPVPDVDPMTAAVNQSLVKPAVPFTPLKPLVDFASAIGFKGPPDRYEQAKKIVAASKAAAAAAAATGSSGKPEVVISGTLRQNASDKAGAKANASASKTDKKQDTKKQDTKKQDTKKKDEKKTDDPTKK